MIVTAASSSLELESCEVASGSCGGCFATGRGSNFCVGFVTEATEDFAYKIGGGRASQGVSGADLAVLDTSESYRRSDVLRTLIQKPDIFRPETREQEVEQWSEWKHMIKNCLSVADTKMLEDMETIEATPTWPSTVDGMDMNGCVSSKNGFEAWRVLVGEMQPATRQRQLALMSQMAGVRFDAHRSLAEQIVKYEELIKEYESVWGNVSRRSSNKSVIQAAPANLQTQLQLTMDESTDYKAIREKLLAYERASTRWQPFSGFALPAVTTQGALNQGGPTDMEIDRVENGKSGQKGGKPSGHKGKKDISDNDAVMDFYDDFPEEPAIRAASARAHPVWRLSDAQGHDIPAEALRRYAFELRDNNGAAACFGGGTWIHTGGTGPRSMTLQSPAGLRAPVSFKHNSLIVRGEVCTITEVPHTLLPKVPKMTLSAEMEALVGNEGMHLLGNGIKMHCGGDRLDGPPAVVRRYPLGQDHALSHECWVLASTGKLGAGYLNEKNPFTLATKVPRPRITLIGMDAFERGEPPERPTDARTQENQQNDPQNAQENQQNDSQAKMRPASGHEAAATGTAMQGSNKEVRPPILQVDFNFASLEEGCRGVEVIVVPKVSRPQDFHECIHKGVGPILPFGKIF
ncbi:unnamed protein product [Symbiodinium sp. CCMP2592]|nr:unnamed protein product [Symbiodinium sp. CCMP2592]